MKTYLRALIFLLLRLRRRTLFFLHLALIVATVLRVDVSLIYFKAVVEVSGWRAINDDRGEDGEESYESTARNE